MLRDPAYAKAIGEVLTPGGTRRVQSSTYGELWVTSVPVRDAKGEAALVLVNFLEDEHEELNNTMRTYAIVGGLSWLAITGLAALQSGRLLRPLRTLRSAAEEISTRDLSLRIEEQGNDDITDLTRTMNSMLDRLDAGFREQRRFLDDAGHELKTPLTVVVGHLEVMNPADEGDVSETRDLVLDEVDRMSRLVSDLTLLTKSRRPDFIRSETVDLAPFTQQLMSKMKVLGDRNWKIDSLGEGLVQIDPQRLTQAVLQLADNAVKHTDEGDVIALGSLLHGHELQIWVRDTGDGVPESDREQIFARFQRSHVRPGDEGFGLGLSIVHAIAEAHHGSVRVESNEPRGSTFLITLTHQTSEDTWPRS